MPRQAKELGALAVSRLTTPGVYEVGGVAGLKLQVLEQGGRTWILRVVIAGKRREMGLGSYSASGIGLAKARDLALAARAAIREGRDPIAEGKAARAKLRTAMTFKQAAETYIAAHEATWAPKHAAQWTATLTAHAFPTIGEMAVKDVSLSDVTKVLEAIWMTTPETASRVRSRIELTLDWATARGHREGVNPARWRGNLDHLLPRPTKVAAVKHHPALPIDDMPAFMVKLRAAEGMGARALHFAILTAARSGEVRGATWAEIDLDAATWIVPAERMKAKKLHRVPLSAPAVALLKALPRIEGSDFVFPAARGGMLSDMTISAVTRRMKIEAVPHGIARSTFRDFCSERTTHPSEVAEMALAHMVGGKVEAAYRRGDLFERRRALMDDWAAFLG